jgi:hypothetical protein
MIALIVLAFTGTGAGFAGIVLLLSIDRRVARLEHLYALDRHEPPPPPTHELALLPPMFVVRNPGRGRRSIARLTRFL